MKNEKIESLKETRNFSYYSHLNTRQTLERKKIHFLVKESYYIVAILILRVARLVKILGLCSLDSRFDSL